MIKTKRGSFLWKRNLGKKNKRAQEIFGMPFATIFSIILIAVFIAVAFYAIKYFLNIKNCSEIAVFGNDFQGYIDDAWSAPGSEKTFPGILPSSIEYVCFANLSEEMNTDVKKEEEIYGEIERGDRKDNLFFYPPRKSCEPSFKMNHIDITELSNPYCIKTKNSKVEIWLENKGGMPVTVSRV